MYASDANYHTVQVGYIRDWCESIAGDGIAAPTFSRWCNYLGIPNRRKEFVPIDSGAALLTFALMRRFRSRDFRGQVYTDLYPIARQRLLEDITKDVGHHDNISNAAAPDQATEV